jgi:serine/threonine protein kinase
VSPASEYLPIKVIGKGAFGVVYSARCPSGQVVAIKKVLQDPRSKSRELDILKLLNHPNCISLKKSHKTTGKKSSEIFLNIVMDFMPTSLHQHCKAIKSDHGHLATFCIKLYAFQMFSGLAYLHRIGVAHRDLKPENVLVDPETGCLKICDFGCAKQLRPGEESTSYIASRYYRAPELILGSTHYTTAVDIWSAGCVVAELLTTGTPIFLGQSNRDQMCRIVRVIGPPTADELKVIQRTTTIRAFGPRLTSLRAVLPCQTPDDLIDLLASIFVYNPAKRPTAAQILGHSCFDELFQPNARMPNGKPLPPLNRADDESPQE